MHNAGATRQGEATLTISLTVSDVKKTQAALPRSADAALVAAAATVVAECPKDFTSSTMGTVRKDAKGDITIPVLAEMRTQLNVDRENLTLVGGAA